MIALSSTLPLRTTAVWGGFGEARAIPHRYGAVAGELLQYDAERRRWVWADHASAGIDAVQFAGQPAPGWTWSNGTDSTGHAVTFVEFADAVDVGVTPIASGRGKLHPVTGALLVSPADVVWDLLAQIGGYAVASSRLEAFRNACAAAELEVAGSVDDATVTLQGVVRGLCDSVGAEFRGDAPELCMLPETTVPATWSIGRQHAIAPVATLDAVVTDVTVRYAYEAGAPTAGLQVDAPTALQRYGRRSRVIEARWVGSARVAFTVARRTLDAHARPAWDVAVPDVAGIVGVGECVAFDHPRLPGLAGTYRVLGRDADLAGERTAITLRIPCGSVPAVRVVGVSSRFATPTYASVTPATIGDRRVLTLTDEDGRPLVGANVTLNGEITRQTDGGGRVEFPASLMPPGQHRLDIVTADGRTWSITVPV